MLERGLALAAAVPAGPVVPVDEAGNFSPGLGLGGKAVAAQQFELEGRVPALDSCVIETRPDAAHRLRHPEGTTSFPEQRGAELRAPVGVNPDSA